MALVHLITANPDRSRKLESDLRSRGYQVSIIAPGDEPASAPDFQIVVEEHSPELALHAAAQMAADGDLAVFISPGSIVDAPIQVIPVIPQPIAEPQPVVALQENETAFAPEVVQEPEVVHAVDVPELAEAPVSQLPVFAQADAELQSVSEPAGAVAEPIADAVPQPTFAAISEPLSVSVPEPISAPVPEPAVEANEPFVPELEAIRGELESVVPELDSSVGDGEQELVTAQAFFADEPPEEPVSDWPIWHPILDDTQVEALAFSDNTDIEAMADPATGEPSTAVASMVHSLSAVKWFGETDWQFWRVATAAAVVAICAFVLGTSYHRVSPLPAAIAEPAPAQQIATPVSLPVRMPAAPHVKSIPVRVPAQAPVMKSAAVRHTDTPARAAGSKSQADVIAPDTVTRYNRHPAAAPTHPAKRVVTSSRRPTESSVVAEDTVTRFGAPATHGRPQK